LQREAVELLGGADDLGLYFANARYATTSNKVGLWVVPGDGLICMFRAVQLVASCTTTAQAYRYGIVLQVYKPDREHDRPTEFASLGIVPDGVKKVPAKVGKQWTTIAVADNTFYVESRRPIGIPPTLQRSSR
jgi:hypothetical protein